MDGGKREGSKAEQWREVIGRQAESGLSVRAFCRQAGVREPSFYAWRRRLAEREAAAAETKAAPGFVRAIVEDPPPGDQPIVLRLASGAVLHLPTATPIAQVAELVLQLHRGGAS